ncbi:uncharacterized protein ddbt isoform X1 [Drosophila virilis]|uniref:Uncharacterized protein, isoform A n=1 Tax=Drosophila virilis TaxID=7244 RepID=B4LXH8_DROVI|nr:uncharacterized protein LOC6631187 isoform X1 [Drosophila virilis]EDW66762.1 uncharacterized protein Dvir_GJ23778, isoform A [Drosophila virilis]
MTDIPRAYDILDNPNLVAPLPYLNFLRYLKRKHPRFGFRRLLQEAPAQWDALNKGQKNLFQKQRILARIARSTRARLRRVLQRNRASPRKRNAVRRPIYDRRPRASRPRKRAR